MNLDTIMLALSGKRVSAKTLPGNTVEVWLDVPPDADNAIVLAVETPWRLAHADSVIATSAEIPWEPSAGECDQDYYARSPLLVAHLTSSSGERLKARLTTVRPVT